MITVNRGFLTIFWRDMLRFFRFKTLLISSLIQPALWMAFFGIAMSSNFDRIGALVPIPPGSVSIDYLTFMAAGIIAMTTLFTSLFGGIILLFDKNWGLLREVMASPMPRNQIVIGIGLSGMTKAFIQAIIIMVFGVIIGVEFFQGYSYAETIGAILAIMLFVGIFALGFLFLSATISISMESPEGLQGIITLLTMPIFFTSNALYPTDAFPPILAQLSAINPLTHLITGIRYFAIGEDFYAIGIHFSYSINDIVISLLVLLLFSGIMFALAWRTVMRAVVT